MGEIRKDNLHESLINELEELANIDLSGKQDKTDESLLTESKDLVGAINELFQSANNGKELIANAIGEPLSSEDTFSAMSTDINGLLSTFKTNMMNNGVTVESSDRFKSLIDKIATMVEEGSGKGIQYAEGEGSWTLDKGQSVVIPTNSNFIPTYVFYIADNVTCFRGSGYEIYNNILLSNLGIDTYFNYTLQNANVYAKLNDFISIKNINSSNFTISTYDNGGSGAYATFATCKVSKWFAIGVGEEDTTLRDSLASILTEEGVSVTEEDDMASLISKVDSEFSDKETEITSLETELEGKISPAGTAVASDVLSGKTFINSTGELITGTNISYTFSNDTNSNFMYLVYSRLSDVQISEWRSSNAIKLYNFTAPFSGTICFSLYGSTYSNGNYGPYFYIYDVTTNTELSDRSHIFSDAAGSPAIRHVTANVTEGHSISLYAAGQGSATVNIFDYYGFQVHYPMS